MLPTPTEAPEFKESRVCNAIKRLKRGKAPGLSQLRAGHLKALIRRNQDDKYGAIFPQEFTKFLNQIANARFPELFNKFLAESTLKPIAKPGYEPSQDDAEIRPIVFWELIN
jgi:hypothetical protein